MVKAQIAGVLSAEYSTVRKNLHGYVIYKHYSERFVIQIHLRQIFFQIFYKHTEADYHRFLA